jgi:hypothetical protein
MNKALEIKQINNSSGIDTFNAVVYRKNQRFVLFVLLVFKQTGLNSYFV